MFIERLRRSQGNVLLGLFNTGVKMLGLGAEEIQKDKTTEILKLLVSESKATSRGNGQYNKVSDINRLSYLLCVSPFYPHPSTSRGQCLTLSPSLPLTLSSSSPLLSPRCIFLCPSLWLCHCSLLTLSISQSDSISLLFVRSNSYFLYIVLSLLLLSLSLSLFISYFYPLSQTSSVLSHTLFLLTYTAILSFVLPSSNFLPAVT